MELRQVRRGGDRGQARLRAEVGVDEADRSGDAREIAAVEECGLGVHRG